jgi:transposase-like protein
MLEPHLTQRALAKLLSVDVRTLADWRRRGKGPQHGWRLNVTTIVYPESEVLRWIDERKAASRRLDELDASKTTFLQDLRRKKEEAKEATG